ncbi:hypothetical protein [Variovorax sp. JS1663]|nr:hypothetical protein [Variovorax sp. JS1663]
MHFLDDSLLPENQQPLVIQAPVRGLADHTKWGSLGESFISTR